MFHFKYGSLRKIMACQWKKAKAMVSFFFGYLLFISNLKLCSSGPRCGFENIVYQHMSSSFQKFCTSKKILGVPAMWCFWSTFKALV